MSSVPAAGPRGSRYLLQVQQGPPGAMERDETLYRMFGRFYPKGTILFNESDPAEEMFLIQSGRVRLTSPDGEEGGSRTWELGSGDLLGEDSFTGGGRRTVRAETVEDSRLLVLGPGNVDSVARNGPELSSALAEALLGRLKTSWEDLRDWQCGQSWQKVKRSLQSGTGKSAWHVSELSRDTGVEEAVIRMILEKLAETGALASEGGSYRILNAGLLERTEFNAPDRGRVSKRAG